MITENIEGCMQEHLFRHFPSPGLTVFLNDVLITFIDKTGPSDPLKQEESREKLSKPWHLLGLTLKRIV